MTVSDPIDPDIFAQESYRCRVEWGRRGARLASERGDILVVVDTLSFSTAVATAIENGGIIYPCLENEDPVAVGARVGAEVAVHRRAVPRRGRFSLSPLTFCSIEPGTRVVLASPNGATCSRCAADVPALLVGALVNAAAVGETVSSLLETTSTAVTILACGERWRSPSEDGDLRMAVEDYLAAGAILAHVQGEKSPEALVCEGAFQHLRDRLDQLLADCVSGRELRARGFAEDVQHASRLDIYSTVPEMRDGRLQGLAGDR